VAAYLDRERPVDAASDRLFVVLKGPRRGRRGRPLSPAGLDQIPDSARVRAGLAQVTCHQLRHTCLTRLREAGMALEAVQAQVGHASIESTRIYLHLADDWLASQYRRAAEAIDAQQLPGRPFPAPIIAAGPPRQDHPLPKALDDPAAARLLRAAQASPAGRSANGRSAPWGPAPPYPELPPTTRGARAWPTRMANAIVHRSTCASQIGYSR
jgi:site-specific recombinase XerC